MTGPQLGKLHAALLAAFDPRSLDRMLLHHLDKYLIHIVGPGSFEDVVDDLLRVAHQQNWLGDLIAAALAANPGNVELKEFISTLPSTRPPGAPRVDGVLHAAEVVRPLAPVPPPIALEEESSRVTPPAQDGPQFAVSYSHADAPKALQVATSLIRAGVTQFVHRVGLSPDDSLQAKLGEQLARLGERLDRVGAVVALLSEHSVQNGWVREELAILAGRGIRIVPVRCDHSTWPTTLPTPVGAAVQVEDHNLADLVGRVPKTFTGRLAEESAGNPGRFFRLATRPEPPYARFFPGTLQAALEEVAFGRTAIVLPTNNNVHLGGIVSTSVFDFLGVSPAALESRRKLITSRHVCDLGCVEYQGAPVHLLASTVFNADRRQHAEDQWRSAAAVLSHAQELRCATVLVPPMGTGAYGWPRSAALRHWLYGAIRWAVSVPLVTGECTWPVICDPGGDGQRLFLEYLGRLDAGAVARIERRVVMLTVSYRGVMSPLTRVKDDMPLGAFVAEVYPALRGRRDLYATHPANDPEWRSHKYDLGTSLNKTTFADGDTIVVQ
jgi:hypothetical protein